MLSLMCSGKSSLMVKGKLEVDKILVFLPKPDLPDPSFPPSYHLPSPSI